jgi:hypothetical protein
MSKQNNIFFFFIKFTTATHVCLHRFTSTIKSNHLPLMIEKFHFGPRKKLRNRNFK